MKRLYRMVFMSLLVLLLNLSSTFSVGAQQPLSTFIEAASKKALDVRTAEAEKKRAAAIREESRGVLLPGASANGRYERNQFEIDFTLPMSTETVNIQGLDQWEGDITVDMPLVDLTAWAGFFQSRSLAESAKWGVSLARLNTFIDVVQQWHVLVASRALVLAAERNLDVAKRASEQAEVRMRVGTTGPLEYSRAKAEVARSEQSLADTKLAVEIAGRRLEDLSFLKPSDEFPEFERNVGAPEPLEQFIERASQMPSVRVAEANRRAAKATAHRAGYALLPAVGGFFTESVTTAAGFAKSRQWVTGLSATWVFDYSRPARVRAERAGLDVAEIDSERAEQQVRTSIYEAWHRVVAKRAELVSALASEEASREAARDAHVRYSAGSSTQLDQIQADRDLFRAEASRIESMANLGIARSSLYLQAGLPLPK